MKKRFLILAVLPLFVFDAVTAEGLDAASLAIMAKKICDGEMDYMVKTDNDRIEYCVQYHDMMASMAAAEQAIHEACAKKSDMDMCIEKRKE